MASVRTSYGRHLIERQYRDGRTCWLRPRYVHVNSVLLPVIETLYYAVAIGDSAADDGGIACDEVGSTHCSAPWFCSHSPPRRARNSKPRRSSAPSATPPAPSCPTRRSR